MASSMDHFKELIRTYRGIRAWVKGYSEFARTQDGNC